MFSKSRINEPGPKADSEKAPARTPEPSPSFLRSGSPDSGGSTQVTKSKSAASVLAADLTVTGNLKTTGDVVIEGNIDGDIRAHLLTVGETATIRGEVVADDIVINGRVIGRVRGLKVRLTSSAQVEGDIIHKTIAIESGAHFEGSVQRQDDPLQTNRDSGATAAHAQSKPATQAPAAAAAPVKTHEPSETVRSAAEAKRSAEAKKA
ncbi:MAG: polymer-forming cytoskeletal protein [Rhodobacteraceae bacterium]|nr:polymer-forming cytoskeletal protein [Paracoccaceae bacterium]TVR48277.1 MAG: polymer-forming cytoskeletal protein [Paracoccaceae bacterium]